MKSAEPAGFSLPSGAPFPTDAGRRSRGISLRFTLGNISDPREIPRLRCAPAKNAGMAKARATPLGMTHLVASSRHSPPQRMPVIYACIRLVRTAKRIKSLKLVKLILRMMWLRWLSTVRVDTPSASATCLLLFPSANN